MKKISLSIIGSVGLPANYGGWETLVNFLCRNISQFADITVYCSSYSYDNKLDSYAGASLRYLPIKANGIWSIPYDILSMVSAFRSDVQLILGVSGCIALPFIKPLTKSKFVVNIDGLEWKRDKWGRFAKWFLKLNEKIAVTFSDVIVTDNAVLQRYVSMVYMKDTVLIPYGGDQVKSRSISDETLHIYPFLSSPYAFKVARIEPENNIELILNAFAGSSLPLVLVGNWSNSDFGRNVRSSFAHYSHLHLLDAIYDQSILDQMRSNAVLYIHGHSAGGTNPSLVEAMNLSLPIFAFDVDFNRETTENKAFYFKNTEDLSNLLSNYNSLELSLCSIDMKSIAERRYSWHNISLQYLDVFKVLCK